MKLSAIKPKASSAEMRRREYMPLSDQVDAAMKGLEAIRQSGVVNLPDATTHWLDHCKAVKEKHPKDSNACD